VPSLRLDRTVLSTGPFPWKGSNPMDRLLLEIRKILEDIPIDTGGGCSVSKAYVMAWLIRRFGMKVSLDLGVYRGRSLFPQGVAHALCTGGTVYGVDPWDIREAMEHETPAEKGKSVAEFLSGVDFQAVYEDVVSRMGRRRLDGNIRLLRKTASAAAEEFRREGVRFDLIHIDGNHDSGKVMDDVRNYLPMVNPGGFVVMDDVSWKSVEPACEKVSETMVAVHRRIDPGNDYTVYWNGDSPFRKALLRINLARIERAGKP
jgi:hypothetical protein